MSLAIIIADRDPSDIYQQLASRIANIDCQIWPNITQPERVEFAVAWQAPIGQWRQYPQLKVIQSFGAGVENLITDDSIGDNVAISRIVDQDLAEEMACYVLSSVLMLKCRLIEYHQQQRRRQWAGLARRLGNKVTILGLGQLGTAVAKRLMINGFDVTGWSRTDKSQTLCPHFSGRQQLPQALVDCDYLINLLPSTPDTKKLVNQALLSQLKPSACFINAGRGATVDEQALYQALLNKQLSFAVLDVFTQEPLPDHNSLWQLKNVVLTPHIAAVTNPNTVIKQIVENYQRFKKQQPLLNRVERERGY